MGERMTDDQKKQALYVRGTVVAGSHVSVQGAG